MNSARRIVGLVLALLACQPNSNGAKAQVASSASRRAFGGVHPRLSPDGQWVAVSYQGAICRLPRLGGTLTRLTRSEGWDIEPAWSPDGQQIAFINTFNYSIGQLRLIRVADGSFASLPTEVRARGKVDFHPDGRRLLGMFSVSGQPDRLAWYDLRSGEVKPVEIEPLQPVHRARMQWALSHDGQWILFTTYQDRPGEQSGNNGAQTELWQVPAKGGVPQRVVRWPSRIYNLCWDEADQGAYATTDRGTAFNDVWHIPLDHSLATARQLTFGQADEDWPSVSRDGRWLVHTENHEGATALVVCELAARRLQAISIDEVNFLEPTGRFEIKLLEAQTGQPAVGRVSLKQRQGKFHAPIGALYRLTAGQGHFYCRGEAMLDVPAGTYELTVVRGPEHQIFKQELALRAGETNRVVARLERWSDMAAKGWYSGENHIHANYGYGAWHNTPPSVLDMCEGEDLHIGNIMVANSDGDGVFDRQFFLGRPDDQSKPRTIIYWNEEFRSTLWGHMTLINLGRLVEPIFTGFKDTTNPWDVPTNADIAERTHHQQGAVSYTHPASNPDSPYDGAYSGKGLPVDAALGRIDTLDVMGFGYEASLRLWYRLLNCGFRLPAAAGTDCFLNRIHSYPPGWGRSYVQLANGLSYVDWVRGQQAGRSFVTTGPMLEFTVDGAALGQTIRVESPRAAKVRGRAWSNSELDRLELLYNGRVVAQGKLSPDKLEAVMDADLPLDQSGWLALRTSSLRRSPLGVPLAAHTSPIYLDLPARPHLAKADAEFFMAWIDRLEADLKKRNRVPAGLEQVRTQLEAARKKYREIANRPTRE
ncbi:MAG: CehA/McbA family metallohydrolase [Verrucomicrobia bacterium]|nr:CehA/McbA family metallohydrolase [Verrucomicrobiota bacterium]